MKRVIFFQCILFLFLSSSGQGKESVALSFKDIRPTMERMFSYHVDYKTLTPKIAHRSIKLYIEQFDPNRIYLLKEEVEPYFEISAKRLETLVEDYKKEQFFEYRDLNRAFERAIKRMREIRSEQIDRLVQKGHSALEVDLSQIYDADYPLNEEELTERVYYRLLLETRAHLQLRKEGALSAELLQKILNHRAKKAFLFEEEYLDRSEHFLTLHILKALAKSLDAHTAYYSPKEARLILKRLEKEFCGIGVIFREDFDGIYVSDLIKNGPADVSKKIQVGDLLLSVNGQKIEGKSFDAFLELVKGRVGQSILLTIKREEKVFHVSLVCQKISMQGERVTFSYEPYGDGIIGKIEIPSFYDNGRDISAFQDLREAIRDLKSKGNLMGIILDFRENTGGFFNQAVKLSSLFVRGALIVMSKDANEKMGYFQAIDEKQFFEGPIVILISKASASATEIVAQALQDYGVALIIGDQRTYGKGSIQLQTITNKNGQAFFKVTVGRYYAPSGRCPQIRGVEGDIFVPTSLFFQNIGEKYLQFPLAGEDLNRDLFHSLSLIKRDSYCKSFSFHLSHLTSFESKWRRMLPILKKNSQARIEKNENYQLFLKQIGGDHRRSQQRNHTGASFRENYGMHDLQIQESVEIIKDMILIDRQKRLQ